jgi:hypothetical protein
MVATLKSRNCNALVTYIKNRLSTGMFITRHEKKKNYDGNVGFEVFKQTNSKTAVRNLLGVMRVILSK